MVRIEDVAQRAGVSTATVSRALRGLPNVAPSTRAAVTRVAEDLGYVASRTASTLAGGRTLAVAVVTPYVARWYFATIIDAVERVLRADFYDALLVGVSPPCAPGASTPAARFEPETLRGRVDAVVVLSLPLSGRELDGVRRLQLPTVFVGAAIGGAMSVRIDDVAVGRTATEHLLALGHHRIAFVGGDPVEPVLYSAPTERRAGWMSALRAVGREPDHRYDVPGLFTVQGGYAAGQHLLALPDPPTAVFAASDEMAVGILTAARAAGRDVPADLSVVGVDGHEIGQVLGLTTVVQPVRGQGELAARLVLQALAGDDVHTSEHVLLPVTLREGGTTGRAAARNPAVTTL